MPFLMYATGMTPAGTVNPVRVRNLHVAPTFLDVAGVAAPKQFEGQSVLPVASASVAAKNWKSKDFVYEYYWQWSFRIAPGTFEITRDRIKYIQFYGIYDLEEIYDLNDNLGEMNNPRDDAAHFQKIIELRKPLYEQLANARGEHAIPYTARLSRGSVRRDKDGTGAAPFPPQWFVDPNRPDRFLDIVPDTPAKMRGGPTSTHP